MSVVLPPHVLLVWVKIQQKDVVHLPDMFRYLNSSNSYSLNFVDYFPGACIVVINRNKRYSCITLFAAELQQSVFVLRS